MNDVRPIPMRTLVFYGGPALGLSFALFFVQFYYLKFATDVLLLSPALMGWLFAAAKIWDAASNPLIGNWSDRTRSRLGRRAPFLLAALPVFAIGFVMLWRPPGALAEDALGWWVAAGLFAFYTAFALYSVPHAALGAELSDDSHERTRGFAARQIAFTLGMMLSFAAIQVAMNADDPRAEAAMIAIPSVVVAALLMAVTPLFVRGPALVDAAKGGGSVVAALRDVWRNKPARILLVVHFVEALGTGAVGVMSPFMTQYVLGRPDLVGALSAAYVVSGVVSIPLWVRISRRFGKRETWLVSMAIAAVAFAGLFASGDGVTGAMLFLVLAGIAMGSGGVLASSILADVIDLDERRTGERKEGIYSAAMSFVLKFGTSLATAASGVVLGAAGFVPNAVQSEESLLGIRFLFAGLPCLGFVAGGLLFLRFSLEPAQRPISSVT